MEQKRIDNSASADWPQSHDPEAAPNRALAEYFTVNSQAFARLETVRKRGWANPEGDVYWQNRRDQVSAPSDKAVELLYKMTQEIAEEMQSKTKALTLEGFGGEFQSLDICMAPGGFTWGTRKYNTWRTATFGLTLPPSAGGYEVRVRISAEKVQYMDVTMLASEYGVESIPETHPDHKLFLKERSFLDKRFQLVFCGGAVIRHAERSEHRRDFERTRLTVSQLILAMNRIVPGGTMVVLLRRPGVWETAHILQQFDSFAEIQLFKPERKHAVRSTFYLIAKNVQPECDSAKAALAEWKKTWYNTTFGGDEGKGGKDLEVEEEAVTTLLNEFGPRLIDLATPVWHIQATALEKQQKVLTRNQKEKGDFDVSEC